MELNSTQLELPKLDITEKKIPYLPGVLLGEVWEENGLFEQHWKLKKCLGLNCSFAKKQTNELVNIF